MVLTSTCWQNITFCSSLSYCHHNLQRRVPDNILMVLVPLSASCSLSMWSIFCIFQWNIISGGSSSQSYTAYPFVYTHISLSYSAFFPHLCNNLSISASLSLGYDTLYAYNSLLLWFSSGCNLGKCSQDNAFFLIKFYLSALLLKILSFDSHGYHASFFQCMQAGSCRCFSIMSFPTL